MAKPVVTLGVVRQKTPELPNDMPADTNIDTPTVMMYCLDQRQSQLRPTKGWCQALLLAANFALMHAAIAQLSPQELGPNYRDRQNPKLSRSGPIYKDPNVYAYTAEFAKRFRMPEEWITTDLQGADAVAWRMMPSYQECGWGGDPNACRQAVECSVDLYFDHQRNPLPWDTRRPERYTSFSASSIRFVSDAPYGDSFKHPNYLTVWRKLYEPVRPGDDFAADNSPFIDRHSGNGLSIQYFSHLGERSGWGFTPFTDYDREVFTGMALVTMLEPGCDGQVAAYVLATQVVRPPLQMQDGAIRHVVLLPASWRERVSLASKAHKQAQEAFFKQEGEKAIKRLGGSDPLRGD